MSESFPASSPKWRRRADARPAEIVRAAYEVFAEKGFAAARLDDIAKRAGVSKGALYPIQALSFTGPFEQLLGMMIPRVAELAQQSALGKVIKMVIGESGNFPEIARIWHDDVIAKGIGLLTSLVARAQERGEVRPGDPRQHALSILVAVIFRETFVPVGAKPFDIPSLMQQHLDTVLPGLLTSQP